MTIRLDQEALKQQAMLYAQEFQIQQLERKVRRAQVLDFYHLVTGR